MFSLVESLIKTAISGPHDNHYLLLYNRVPKLEKWRLTTQVCNGKCTLCIRMFLV